MTRLLLTSFALAACAAAAHGQAEPAGIGPGGYLSLGVSASAYTSGYGHQTIAGATIYLDANPYRRIGSELEARTFQIHAEQSFRQSTLLAGPRISTHARTLRPYAKLLAGRGSVTFPYSYAHGSYFVAAPGVGLDWRVASSRVQIRLFDLEYQYWPDFTFGPMHPWGASTGLSLRLW